MSLCFAISRGYSSSRSQWHVTPCFTADFKAFMVMFLWPVLKVKDALALRRWMFDSDWSCCRGPAEKWKGRISLRFEIQQLWHFHKSLEPSNETVGGGAKLSVFEAASDLKIGTIPLWKTVFESKSRDLLFDSTSFGRSSFILPQGFSDGANSEGFLLFCSHHNKNKKNEEPCEAARGDGG